MYDHLRKLYDQKLKEREEWARKGQMDRVKIVESELIEIKRRSEKYR